MRRGNLLTLSLLVLSVAASHSATAADIVVRRSDDPAIPANFNYRCDAMLGCSLRQAVLIANNRPGEDQIQLSKKTYTLTQTTSSTTIDGKKGPLWVAEALKVEGASAALTRIRWTSGFHVSHKHQVFVNDGNLELDGLTVSDGRGDSGGCINARGDLWIRNAVVENCRAVTGGAIKLNTLTKFVPASFFLYSSIIRDNRADQGGAIAASGGTTIITGGAQIVNNTASGNGGAISLSSEPMYSSSDPLLWYNNGGASVIADNTAGGDGGGFYIWSNGSLAMYNLQGGLGFERNVASGNGGAVAFNSGTTNGWSKAQFGSIRFDDNAASNGGAISARQGNLLIEGSQFNRNEALSGNGGALQLESLSSTAAVPTWVRQSTFNQNLSASSGGAISNQCQFLGLGSTSLYNNNAISGGGSAVASSGNTRLLNVTTDGHNPTGAAFKSTLYKTYHTMCGAQPFMLANSIIGGADSCYSPTVGTITSNGGNQYGPQAGGCTILSGIDHWNADASVFGLSIGNFGGNMPVLGWNNDGLIRPQVDSGVAANCEFYDVLGRTRTDGACDAGAFEQF